MRTIAVRIDDDTADLLDALSDRTRKRTSDLVRVALRNLFASAAETDPDFARLQAEKAERSRAAHDQQLEEKLGLTPVSLNTNEDD